MDSSVTWKDMRDHYRAQAKMFDQRAKESRAQKRKAKTERRFVDAVNWKVIAREQRESACEYRTKALEIDRIFLRPRSPP